MMKFFLIFLPAVLVILTGGSESMKKGLDYFPRQFFPMKEGQSWKYSYKGMTSREVEIRVIGRKESNGKTYFQLSQWFHLTPQDDPVWIAWKDGALYLDDGKGREMRWIPGEPESTSLVAGTQTETAHKTLIFRDCLQCRDAGSTFVFAENQGIISVEFMAIWGVATYKLVGTNAAQENAR